jgi:hypothetical protein
MQSDQQTHKPEKGTVLLLTALSPLATATGSILPVTTGVASRLFDGLAATRIPFLGPTKAFGEVAGAMVCSGFGWLLGMDDRKRRALDERICSPPQDERSTVCRRCSLRLWKSRV